VIAKRKTARAQREPVRRKPSRLREKLEELAARFDERFLHSDPVRFPRRYQRSEDREIVAFLASAYAYGGVKQIGASVERLLGLLAAIDPRPARAVDRWRLEMTGPALGEFRHRFNGARDAGILLWVLRRMREQHGSIEGFFGAGAPAGAPMRERLSSFSRRAAAIAAEADATLPKATLSKATIPAAARNAGPEFFFSDPLDGSACKRLCMFLRWMARPADGIDFGQWSCVTPAELVMPLDTHTTRICYLNGLAPSAHATWRNAEIVTEELRRFDANDPVRFDFALSRLGILRIPRDEAAVRVAVRKRARRAVAGASGSNVKTRLAQRSES
jgi:uncharacterized protein (TIGR02757 family)